MLSIFNGLRDITFWSVLVRLLMAFFVGAVIGLERSAKNRPAGLRTHVLVAVGAATASLTGHYIYLVMQLPSDLTRLGAQVITGLGFIGAGTIIVTNRQKIKGLTTAAGLWATGVIGLAIGAGYYEGGLVAAALILLAETAFFSVGMRIQKAPQFNVQLSYGEKSALDHVLRCCKDHGIAITSLHIIGAKGKKAPVYSAAISLRATSVIGEEELLQLIRGNEGVIGARITE